MSASTTKPIPTPTILVYGCPTGHELKQASWFRAEDKAAAKIAAETMKFSVLDLDSDAAKALAASVHEGVLKGSGRMIVGSVTPDVYKRIEEYAVKASKALAVAAAGDTAARVKAASEQTMNISDGKPDTAPIASDPWDGLRVGSYVVAKHWYSGGEANGWWIAEVTAINGKDFTIRWPDEPNTPPLKAERKHLAILNAAFDVNREWDNKR